MPGLDPGIHVLRPLIGKDVDGRVKPGHDEAVFLTLPPQIPKKPPAQQKCPEEISMSLASLESSVNSAFDARDSVSTATRGEVRDAVDSALELLDKGEARVAEREAGGKWKVNQWLKKAVLLSFRLNDMSAIAGGPGQASWWDKVPSKFDGWGENRHRENDFHHSRRISTVPCTTMTPCRGRRKSRSCR